MPWICEECGALEGGDMCRSCGNIAAVKVEPAAHPESMFAKQGLRTGSSFKFHSALCGFVLVVCLVMMRLTGQQDVPFWQGYALAAFLFAPFWMPPILKALRKLQEAYYRWRFKDRV